MQSSWRQRSHQLTVKWWHIKTSVSPLMMVTNPVLVWNLTFSGQTLKLVWPYTDLSGGNHLCHLHQVTQMSLCGISKSIDKDFGFQELWLFRNSGVKRSILPLHGCLPLGDELTNQISKSERVFITNSKANTDGWDVPASAWSSHLQIKQHLMICILLHLV